MVAHHAIAADDENLAQLGLRGSLRHNGLTGRIPSGWGSREKNGVDGRRRGKGAGLRVN